MINLPPDTQVAIWLTAVAKTNGICWPKHYIIAHNNDFLFRVFNRQDGVFIGNIIEDAFTLEGTLGEKVLEKTEKGYTKLAGWDQFHKVWRTPSRPNVVPDNVLGILSRRNQDLVAKVDLRNYKANNSFDQITVELWRTAAGRYRLDQTESTQSLFHKGFPLWQTLFSNEEKAKEILREVIERKMELGFIAYRRPIVPAPGSLAALYPLMPATARAFMDQKDDIIWF